MKFGLLNSILFINPSNKKSLGTTSKLLMKMLNAVEARGEKKEIMSVFKEHIIYLRE